MRKTLTQATVERTTPPQHGRLEIHDTMLPGLVLRITSTGHRTYTVHARIRGRLEAPVRYTIGPAHLYSLSEARDRARDVLRQLHDGKDPREERRVQAALLQVQEGMRFEAVVQEWLDTVVSRQRRYRDVESIVRRHLLPRWSGRLISDVAKDDIADLIRELSGKPATAIIVKGVVSRLLGWCASPSMPRERRLPSNPAAGLSGKAFGLKVPMRQTVLSNDELRAVWTATGAMPDPWDSFFHLLLLLPLRRGELTGLHWSEINFAERVIVLPPERMKSGRAFEMPLSGAAYEILALLHERHGDTSWPWGRQLDTSTVKRALDRLRARLTGDDASWRLHDWRRTVRTHLGAIPQIPHDVAELCLAHVSPALTRTYNLHSYRDEKRQALTLWSERLARIVEPSTGSTVTPLRRTGR